MLPLTKSCPHEMGKVDTNECEWPKGEYQKAAKLFYCSPSVGCADSSPASGGAFNSLSLFANAHSQLPLRGSLLVRFTSSHIKPALKGEVAMSDSFFPQPLSRLAATAPRPGSLLVQCKRGVQCRTPRGAIVSMGLRGSPGGLRGEIEIFPGPLAKKL